MKCWGTAYITRNMWEYSVNESVMTSQAYSQMIFMGCTRFDPLEFLLETIVR